MKKSAEKNILPKKRGGARPGSGRPKSENPRSLSLSNVRISQEDREQIESQAAKSGQTVSDWVRGRLGL